jgi:hypothetical protein
MTIRKLTLVVVGVAIACCHAEINAQVKSPVKPSDAIYPAAWPPAATFLVPPELTLRVEQDGFHEAVLVPLYASETPAGRRQFVAALQSPDPKVVAYAIRFLGSATDFDVIRPLLDCAVKYGDNAEILKAAVACVMSIMDDPFLAPPEMTKARDMGPARLRDYYLNDDRRWKETTWAEHFAARVTLLLKSRPPGRLGEAPAVAQRFIEFIASDDAEHATPPLIDWIAYVDPTLGDRDILFTFMRGLQVYVGPLDLPANKDADAAEFVRAQKQIASWWASNKSKPPTLWLLDRLVARGYVTNDPPAGQTTALATYSALQNGDDVERYAAARFLAHALPNGDSLLVRRFAVFETNESSDKPGKALTPADTRIEMMKEYLDTIALARTQRWYLMEFRAMEWDAKQGRYRERSR